jgi:hypothetical protein
VALIRIERDDVAGLLPAESYETRVDVESAQVYTTPSIVPADHVVAVTMRVPLVGYLRAVWLTSVALAAILLMGRWLIGRLEEAMAQRADAAVALLLVAPSLLAAYLIRPGEHAIASRLLRPIRYAIAVAGSLSYVGAASLVLGWRGTPERVVWTVIAAIAALIAIGITIVVDLTRRDLNEVAAASLEPVRRTIVVMPYARDSD